jgi:hypothetical protein
LRISFWKEPEPVDSRNIDPEILRTRYVEDARRVAEKLAKDENLLAIGLSGPFDLQRVQPASDMHLVILLEQASHIYYHHMLPSFSPVGRRLEIACLSFDYLNAIAEKGYSSWNDVYDMHKLDDMVILHEKGDHLNRLREKIKILRPGQIFIGRQLASLRHEFGKMDDSIRREQYRETVLEARRFLPTAMKILLLAGRQESFAKVSHLYRALLNLSGNIPALVSGNWHGLNNIDGKNSEKLLAQTDKLIKNLFQRKIVCNGVSD